MYEEVFSTQTKVHQGNHSLPDKIAVLMDFPKDRLQPHWNNKNCRHSLTLTETPLK